MCSKNRVAKQVTSIMLVACMALTRVSASIPEPYPPLNRDDPTGAPARPSSVDPLVQYTWSTDTNFTQLQSYTASPVGVDAYPPSSFDGIDTAIGPGPCRIRVLAPGRLRFAWGPERAAWFEFESNVGSGLASRVYASVSEYSEPMDEKWRVPVSYDNGTKWRLETNPQLYEGVRYTWLELRPSSERSGNNDGEAIFTITSVRLTAQVKAVNYTGSFSSPSRPSIERAWYTGAYGVRLNMLADAFGSILVERGDRVSIQGDGHPTMQAALAAFGGDETYSLVERMINATDSGCQGCHVVDDGIMAYPLYWTMSLNDWFWASGDKAGFARLAPDAATIIARVVASFGSNPNLVWMGWDDRVGNGWCGPTGAADACPPEAQYAFAALAIRAASDFAKAAAAAGLQGLSQNFSTAARNMTQVMRGWSAWPHGLGVHSAANAINAGIAASGDEIQELVSAYLNDSVTVCSWSPFNTFFILQALGNAGQLDRAHDLIDLCWGPMLSLGRGCFWELFSPEWARFMQPGDKAPTRPSMCHPWSSGVTSYLSKFTLGITPLLPGFSRYAAAPHLSSAHPLVSGSVGTPRGTISVDAQWNATSGQVTVRVESHGAPGRVGVPVVHPTTGAECSTDQVKIFALSNDDRKQYVDVTVVQSTAGSGTRLRASHIYTPILPPGKHTIVAQYEVASEDESVATPPSPRSFPPRVYPSNGTLDTATRGAWTEKYGRDGYVLFAFDNGTDRVRLGGRLSNVSFFHDRSKKSVFAGAGPPAQNATWLRDPKTPSSRAALGYASNGADGSQGLVLDVELSGPARVSLYMCARDVSWRQAIRVMDLKSLSVIAPTPLVANYTGGTYYTVKVKASVRLRIMSINGLNTAAALFVDSV